MQYIELRNNLKQKPIVECFMGKSRTTRFVLALLMFASLGAVAGAGASPAGQNSQQQSPSSSSPQTWNQLCTQNPSNPSSPSWNKILQQSNPSPGNTHWNQLITANTYPDHLCPYTPGCQTIQGACATIAGTYGVPAGYTIGSIVLHDCGGTITTNQGGCSPPPPVPSPPVVQHHAAPRVAYQPPTCTTCNQPPPVCTTCNPPPPPPPICHTVMVYTNTVSCTPLNNCSVWSSNHNGAGDRGGGSNRGAPCRPRYWCVRHPWTTTTVCYY